MTSTQYTPCDRAGQWELRITAPPTFMASERWVPVFLVVFGLFAITVSGCASGNWAFAARRGLATPHTPARKGAEKVV